MKTQLEINQDVHEDYGVLLRDQAAAELCREYGCPLPPMPTISRLDITELEANLKMLRGREECAE